MPAFTVAAKGLPVVDLSAQPLEVGVEQDVDHAGDRVGAVGRRSAAGHGLDALDHRSRNKVEIDRAAIGCRNEPAGVDQRERCAFQRRVEAAQVGVRKRPRPSPP
jgi:hypothetical protein